MDDGQRARAGRVTLATIALAAATVYSSVQHRSRLAKSFEANASEWSDEPFVVECCFDECGSSEQTCFDQLLDDHCYRELYRAQVEGLDATSSR